MTLYDWFLSIGAAAAIIELIWWGAVSVAAYRYLKSRPTESE